MKILGVIPARGGSKGIKRKNLAPVGGRPLIAWTIEQALKAKGLTELVLSTEDEEIAEVACSLGVEVPFMRPAELASESTPTLDVLVHLCEKLADQGRTFDGVCLLQPTSPERPPGLIDQCIARWIEAGTDSLVTVTRVPHQFNPHWVYWKDERGYLELSTGGVEPIPRRQLLPPAVIRDGRIYLTKTRVIIENRSLFGSSVRGFEVSPGINIDTPEDLERFRNRIGELEKHDGG